MDSSLLIKLIVQWGWAHVKESIDSLPIDCAVGAMIYSYIYYTQISYHVKLTSYDKVVDKYLFPGRKLHKIKPPSKNKEKESY